MKLTNRFTITYPPIVHVVFTHNVILYFKIKWLKLKQGDREYTRKSPDGVVRFANFLEIAALRVIFQNEGDKN